MHLRSDTIIGGILLVLLIAFFVTTFFLPRAPYGTMGPALFPRVLLFALFPLSAGLFLKGLMQDLRQPRPKSRPFADWFHDYRNVLASYVLFFLFAWALPYAGYLITSFVFLLGMQVLLGPKSWRKVPQYLAIAVGVLAILFILFRWLLLVLLPEGEIF
ncbi:MAG: tripartite tricarboxylate transporter TctB family protein [Candidatus Binatia bacterium]